MFFVPATQQNIIKPSIRFSVIDSDFDCKFLKYLGTLPTEYLCAKIMMEN